VLVALNLVVTHGGSSTMILRLGMRCMGLCSICLGRCNPREKKGVLVKACKSGGRWAIPIGIAGLDYTHNMAINQLPPFFLAQY
jgi:hypothetical protein